MRSTGCFNENGNELSGSKLGVPWPAEQLLLPQEGFCTVELVCYDFDEYGSEGMLYYK
jgi:hypothetical protein